MIKIIVALLVSSIFVGTKLYKRAKRNKEMGSDGYIPFYNIGEVPEIDCVFRKTGIEGDRSLEFYKEVRKAGEMRGKVLPMILGRDEKGEIRVVDLVRYPHVLVAGATNMGKSNFINSVILGLFLHVPYQYIDIYIIDFKKTGFFEMKHLLEIDTSIEEAKLRLEYLLRELEKRSTILVELELKNWQEYVQYCIEEGLEIQPYKVCVIDEYNSLKKENQEPIEKLVAQARAVGIYMVLCTQYPKIKVMNSEVTSQCLTRCCFKMASEVQERVVLDNVRGATNLGIGYFYHKGVENLGVHYSIFVGNKVLKIVGKNIGEYVKGPTMRKRVVLSNSAMLERERIKNSVSILSRLF